MTVAIPDSRSIVPSNATLDNIDIVSLTARYSLPKISLQTNRNRALVHRAYKPVPDLPPGWRAIFSKSTALVPVSLSAPQLRDFYVKVARAVIDIDKRWQWTIQMGQMVLRFTSRDRSKPAVTKYLIVATVFLLKEFANSGFTDLFVARLWEESDGTIVDIQLTINLSGVEGVKVT
ncbi:MAG: hypothetical protein Q9219_002295 [cf. Caloplaca sp. 3 TL-2023]